MFIFHKYFFYVKKIFSEKIKSAVKCESSKLRVLLKIVNHNKFFGRLYFNMQYIAIGIIFRLCLQ